MPINEDKFAERYGPWALINGGSDGLGAAFAEEIAKRGVNLVLVARRQGPLDDVAGRMRERHDVQVRTISLDLGASDAAGRLGEATADLDLGLVVFNAGADSSGERFLDLGQEARNVLIRRNILFLTEALHLFGTRLRSAGRGGLIVVGSEAAFGGGARGALYTATKGFALNLCESLWAEMKPCGVDVLTLLFRIADTPTLREALARKSIPIEATGALAPERLARETIRALPDGPVYNFDDDGTGSALTDPDLRRARVLDVTAQLEGFYGTD